MDLLIHATLTVSGDRAQLAACDARIKSLLVEEVFSGEFEEHHGDDALSYDFKVRGGIPFPAFAAASQEFPGMTITAEWVNVAAGRKGRAQIVAGKITEHAEESVVLAAGDTRNRHVQTAPDGTLLLAVALVQTGNDAWVGYVLNHERDALFCVTRSAEAVEFLATEGAPEWVLRWQILQAGAAVAGDAPTMEVIASPQPVNKKQYAELEQLAESFVADWIWFREGSPEASAIHIDRFARYGYTVRAANVRAARLHALRNEAGAGQPMVHTTVEPECAWIIDVLWRCWADSGDSVTK